MAESVGQPTGLYELTYTIKVKHGQFVSDDIDSVRKHEDTLRRIIGYCALRGLHLELITDVHAVPTLPEKPDASLQG